MSQEHDQQNQEKPGGYVPQVHLESESVPEIAPEALPEPWQTDLKPPENREDIPVEALPEEPPEEPIPPEKPIAPPIIMPPSEEPEPEPEPDEPPEPKKKKNKLLIALTCLFAVLALAIIGGVSYVYFVIKPYESYDKIMPNVYCAGINLGGMTKEEAKEAIEEALRSPSNSVKVILPDGSYTFQPEQEGVTLNADSVADRAYRYLRSDTSAS